VCCLDAPERLLTRLHTTQATPPPRSLPLLRNQAENQTHIDILQTHTNDPLFSHNRHHVESQLGEDSPNPVEADSTQEHLAPLITLDQLRLELNLSHSDPATAPRASPQLYHLANNQKARVTAFSPRGGDHIRVMKCAASCRDLRRGCSDTPVVRRDHSTRDESGYPPPDLVRVRLDCYHHRCKLLRRITSHSSFHSLGMILMGVYVY